MKLLLKRTEFADNFTCGRLYVNGEYICYVLEDKVRDMPKEKKVYGETAIPAGEYEISMNVVSPRYSKISKFGFTKGFMPRLLHVPYYEGVLIHSGNVPKDTLGCLLVGYTHVKGEAYIGNSFAAFKDLYSYLMKAKNNREKITIEIVNEKA